MKVLVTGATGFVGQRTAKILQARGFSVVGLGRNCESGERLAQHGIGFQRIDLLDPEKLMAAMKGQDAVVHCGALSTSWGSYSKFYQSNVVGTRNVIAACQAHGIKRLVHLSSPSIYVDTRSRLEIREEDALPAASINHYSATKLLAEQEVDRAVKDGLSAITLRPQAIIGAGDPSIMPRFVRLAQKGFIPKIGSTDVKVDVTYVENVAEAIYLAVQVDSIYSGKKYNITNGEPMAQQYLIQKTLGLLGIRAKTKAIGFKQAWWLAGGLEQAYKTLGIDREPPLTRYAVCVLSKSRTLNIDAARTELGYRPKHSVDEGIQDFVRSWRN